MLERREKEIFDTLKSIKDLNFVVIGGYSVNAYTLPRFSIDCDIVVIDDSDLEKIISRLIQLGYTEEKESKDSLPYIGRFKRYVKQIQKDFKVSIDILITQVSDRQTNSIFPAKWIFDNSQKRILQGKTISEELTLNIIDIDALFVMKAISCRETDIRDLFMLVSDIKNKSWIKEEIENRYSFDDRLAKIEKKINSKEFKDNLQGVFGKLPEETFNKQKRLIAELRR